MCFVKIANIPRHGSADTCGKIEGASRTPRDYRDPCIVRVSSTAIALESISVYRLFPRKLCSACVPADNRKRNTVVTFVPMLVYALANQS